MHLTKPLRPFLFLVAALWLLAAPVALSARDLDLQLRDVVRAANIGKTKVALYAVDLNTGFPIVKLNADVPMIPASNLKIITSAAAIKTLGPGFYFETKLNWANPPTQQAPTRGLNDAVLIIKGDGDPAFGDTALLEQYGKNVKDVEQLVGLWIAEVKKAGITKVNRLVVDDGVFDQTFVHESWPRDQLNRWYCAQVAGINFHTNCLDVYPQPAAYGDSPIIRVLPDSPFVPKSNMAATGSSDTFWISRKLGTNQITFRGSVKHRRTSPVHVTIHDPPMYFGRLLADRLGKAGIAVAAVNRPTPRDDFSAARPLHIMRTPLRLVVSRCNKNSQNLYAEAMFKRMGRQLTGAPGSFETGAAAVRRFLQQTIGTDAASVRTADGSGMSRQNVVTARVMVDVLTAMARDEKAADLFRDSLAVGGKDGTLEKRLRRLNGVVYGKTGYIRGVSCLSGYYLLPWHKAGANTTAGGRRDRVVAFSFLFNDFRPSLDVIMKLQEDLVKIVDQTYAK